MDFVFWYFLKIHFFIITNLCEEKTHLRQNEIRGISPISVLFVRVEYVHIIANMNKGAHTGFSVSRLEKKLRADKWNCVFMLKV